VQMKVAKPSDQIVTTSPVETISQVK